MLLLVVAKERGKAVRNVHYREEYPQNEDVIHGMSRHALAKGRKCCANEQMSNQPAQQPCNNPTFGKVFVLYYSTERKTRKLDIGIGTRINQMAIQIAIVSALFDFKFL